LKTLKIKRNHKWKY